MGANIKIGNSRGRKRSLNSEINITPFVDVMLVLLIIFMVTSPMLVAGIKVDLPSSQSTPIQASNDEPLSIDIDATGQTYIQEVPILTAELTQKLIHITKEKFDTKIFIRGDKKIDYGKVMDIMRIINNAGFTKVALITEVKPENKK